MVEEQQPTGIHSITSSCDGCSQLSMITCIQVTFIDVGTPLKSTIGMHNTEFGQQITKFSFIMKSRVCALSQTAA